MLPGPVLVILRVLAWLLPPHLVLAVSSLFISDVRCVFVCCTLAIISVVCALSLHSHDRTDERITNGLAAQERALDAVVHAVDVVAGDPVPEPPSRSLRVVRPHA